MVQACMDFAAAPGPSAVRLEAAIQGGGTLEARVRGVERLKRLVGVARHTAHAAFGAVDELAQRVENGLLERFHTAFDAGDVAGMQQAAALLRVLNGGASCVQSFVGQHAFFLDPVLPEAIGTRYGAPGAVVDYGAAEEVDPALAALFGEITATSEQDWRYLQEVFEDPAAVMDALLTRIFHEPVQAHLEAVLQQARRHSSQAYLRALMASHRAALALVADLGRVYERHAASPEGLQKRLGDLVGELFSPHLEPTAYLRAELESLGEVLELATAPACAALRQRRAKTVASFFSAAPAPAGRPLEASLRDAARLVFDGEPLAAAADTDVSEQVVRRCLVVDAEAAARLYTLLPADPAALEQAWARLLDGLLGPYLEAALDAAVAAEPPAGGCDRAHWLLLARASSILASLQAYFQASLLPLLVKSGPAVYRQAVQAKAVRFAAVAGKANALALREVRANLTWVKESLLVRQRRSDYRPREDAVGVECSAVRVLPRRLLLTR